MKISPLDAHERQLVFAVQFKHLEYTERIIELALALHIYAGFEMIGVTRHEGAIKEVYAYDVSRRIYTFRGPGRTIVDHNFENMRPIDEETVRKLYQVNEEWIEKIAHVAQALWPLLAWNEKSAIKKKVRFIEELDALCMAHQVSLRTSDPNGIMLGNFVDSENWVLSPSTFPGEFKIKKEQ